MAYDTITAAEVAQDAPGDTDLFTKIKNNIDYLYNRAGGIGGAMNLISNGSFEDTDSVTDYPTDWTVTPGSGNTVATGESNTYDSGYKAVEVTLGSTNAATLVSAFGEISPKGLLKWALKAGYGTNSLAATKIFKVRLTFYLGDGSSSNGLPDVDGSSYPQPGIMPINAYATAGAGYVEYDLSSAAVFPHTAWGAIPPLNSFSGVVMPPTDARYFKLTITLGIASLVTSYRFILDSAYAVQPHEDGRAYAVASDTLQISLDTEKSTLSQTYVKAKRFKVYQSGTYRIKFDLKSSGATPLGAFGLIYKNGIAYGTEKNMGGTVYATQTESSLYFGAGDEIEVYIRVAVGFTGYRTYIQNFRLYFDVGNTYGYGKEVL